MKIISWNVNGIRAAIRNGIVDSINDMKPDVLCLQEVKAKFDQAPDQEILDLGYRKIWNSGERPGYSGTATYSKIPATVFSRGINGDDNDPEGRVIRAEINDIIIYNIYFPNGQRGMDRLDFKLEFYTLLLGRLKEDMKSNRCIIVCGDFNTAHKPIDLANPKENEMNSGFLLIERKALSEYMEAGFVDIYRRNNPDRQEFTWWTYRFNARVRGIGWRIDYFMVSEQMLDRIAGTNILANIRGSDHCPIALDIL